MTFKLISKIVKLSISTHQNVHFDFNDESGCLKIEIKDLNTKRGVFRIMADIIEPEYVHP